jgi:hypothetical protein
VARMHTQRDLRLLAVSAEGPLADQEAHQQTVVEFRKLCHQPVSP